MDTRYFQTFREVAKWQSFTKAAEVLGYAQSSVTTQIQNLETEFGVILFERWGRKIRLTHSGEQLLRYTDQVLSLLEEAKETLAEETCLTGTLAIGTVESLAAFYLPPYLQTFRRQHPGINLLLQPGICSDLRQGVKDGTYDFAVILDWLQEHPDLTCINLGEEELVVIASPDHRLASRDSLEPQDFAGENWIFTEAGCSYRSMMEGVLRDAATPIETSLEFGSLEAIKQCVAYGLGVALLPRIAVTDEVRKGKLAILPFQHPDIRVFRQLVYHKKKWMPRALQRFLDLLLAGVQKETEQAE
jgi:DNA-binding transcriptional LysR family regulator